MVLGKQSRSYVDASKVAVGEIDTSSPFESVKHAVSIFGAVAFTRKRTQLYGRKPRTQSSEKLSVKESRLHLAQKELNKLKENLSETDMSKTLALAECENARKTIEELSRELSVVNKSKDVVLGRIEHVQEKSSSNIFSRTLSSCRRELDTLTVQYLAAARELNELKKGLGKLRQDYDSDSRSFSAALKQSSEAEAASKANKEAALEISEKISRTEELIKRVKVASDQAEEEKLRIGGSKEILRHDYNSKSDALAKTLERLKMKLDPDTVGMIQIRLENTSIQEKVLKKNIQEAKDLCSELTTMLVLELDNEKSTLQKLLEEESSLRQLIESLKVEKEHVKKELFGMNGKEAEARHLVEDLEAELQKNQLELEKCMMEESNVRNTCDVMKATLVHLLTECHGAKQEAKANALETEAVVKEADYDRSSIKEYETKLQLLLQEVEAARFAEGEAIERVKILSKRKDPVAKVTLALEDFNFLSVKINDSAKLADLKVSEAMLQVELVKASQNANQVMLKGCRKELKGLKLKTVKTQKMAEEAEGDEIKLKGELERLKQCLLNKAECVTNSKTLCEIEIEQPLSNPKWISKSYSANRRRVTLRDFLKIDMEIREKGKRAHMRSLSGIFRGL